MNQSRRKFIKLGVLSAACAGTVLLHPNAGAAQTTGATDLFASKSAADFERLLGAEFMLLREGSGALPVTLAEVSDELKNTRPTAVAGRAKKVKKAPKNFVLSFRFPDGEFPQETYQLWHPECGQFELFLVPDRRSSATLMHAVINRL